MTATKWVSVWMVIGLAACAGAQQEAEDPSYAEQTDEPGYDEVDQSDVPSGATEEEPSAKEEKAESVPEPQFTEGMTVEQAINAVPQGVPRVNMEMDVLARPLAEASAYDSCKPAGSQHFTVKVAVWDGRAVGVDVKTTPNNPKLAECVAQVVRGMQWDDKAKSLNTVEYSF